MSKSCVICGGEESEGELLVQAPCGNHFVCADDITSFFERATNNESLFPPKCCGQMFMLFEYEEYIPFETSWAYQMKEQGEYAILAKYRVYCANQPCAKFLHPTSHVTDPDTNITYAICEDENCGKLTCCSCRTLLHHGTQNHICQQTEDEKKFKEIATKKGYQECGVCGTTVELAEACNHITCECGHEFCYVCGRQWPGLHRCPNYGPAEYDDEGYNQDGFHRDTGLNRAGLTRRQDLARARGEPEDEDNEGEDEEEEDPDWEVLQHIGAAEREVINLLPAEEREDALDNLRIMLHTTRGITFNQGQAQAQPEAEIAHEVNEDGELEDETQDNNDRGVEENANDENNGNNNHALNEETLHVATFHDLMAEQNFPTAGSDVREYLRNDFNDRPFIDGESQHAESHEANNGLLLGGPGHTSSSSDSGDILPATPMDRNEPTEELKGLDQGERPVVVLAPPGAWVDDEEM